jgi:threonine/homoserine efflux transporter RhtA
MPFLDRRVRPRRLGHLLGAVTLTGQREPAEHDDATDGLDGRDGLAEQQPGGQHGEHHLGQADERREPRPQAGDADDAEASAFAFGSSGPFAKSLMEAGWSPTAAVTARLAGGALLMAIFATIVKPDWFREALQHAKTVVAYGLIPIAGAQLCYFNAVAHLSVGVALLLEYTAPILVVGWLWATTRRRPSNLTLSGVAMAIAGIMLVLNVFSGAHINLIGVGWALAAAVCAACYFMMSDEVAADGDGLNSITLATGRLIVGTAAVASLGATGLMPMTFTTNDAVVAGLTTSWVVPVIALALIPTAIAYTHREQQAEPEVIRGLGCRHGCTSGM